MEPALTALDQTALPGTHQPLDLQMRQDHFRDIERVRTDIAEHIARACEPRIDTPTRGRVLLLDRRTVETMGELQVDDPDLAKVAVLHHRPCLLDHLMTGIAVGNADDLTARLRQRLQLLGLRDGEAERLFADDMQAVFERCRADCEMGVVRRGDRHRLNAIRPFSLCSEHRHVVRIAASLIKAQIDTESAPTLRIDIEGTGHEFERAVS
jgi:hypothetical protein